ncbi:signal peptide peptidase [Tanacetum coccineum]
MIAPGSSRNSQAESYGSNDMDHNYFIEEARKTTQERNRNLKPREIPSARTHHTPDACKPNLRSNNQTSRNWSASKSNDVTLKVVQKAYHSRNPSSFTDSKHFVCSTCQKCVFNANHDACVTKFLKEANSRVKAQSPKTRNSNKPVEQISHTQTPVRQIFTTHRFSTNKSSDVYEKTSPRSCLRWKPTGRIFNIVGLRWVPTGNIFTSSTTKVDSEPPNGSDEDITKPYECKQTLNVSAETMGLRDSQLIKKIAMVSVDNTSGPTPQRKITSDHFRSRLGLHQMTSKYFRSKLNFKEKKSVHFSALYLQKKRNLLPPLSVIPLMLPAAAPLPADTTGTPSSTIIDQDAPSASTSPTTQEIQAIVIHQARVLKNHLQGLSFHQICIKSTNHLIISKSGQRIIHWTMSLAILLDLSRQELNYKLMSYGAALMHMDIRYHFIKEHLENGLVELYFIKTEYRLADLFPKLLNVLQKKRKSNGGNSSRSVLLKKGFLVRGEAKKASKRKLTRLATDHRFRQSDNVDRSRFYDDYVYALACLRDMNPSFDFSGFTNKDTTPSISQQILASVIFSEMVKDMRAEIFAKKETLVNFLTDASDGRSTLEPTDVLVFGWVEGKHECMDLTGVSPLVGLSSRGLTLAPLVMKVDPNINVILTACLSVFVGCYRSVKSTPPIETMSKGDAMCIPLVSSAILLSMFLLFKFVSKDLVNAVLTCFFFVLGILALSETLVPAIRRFLPTKWNEDVISWHFPYFRSYAPLDVEFTRSQVVAAILGTFFCVWYVAEKHWLANNVLGLAFCIQSIEMLSLGSFKTGGILLGFVFTSSDGSVSQSFDVILSFFFPTRVVASPYSMLGLGDIVIPGMAFLVDEMHPVTTSADFDFLLQLALRFDVSRGNKCIYLKSGFSTPALLYIVPAVIGFLAAHCIWNGEVKPLLEFDESKSATSGEGNVDETTSKKVE